MFAKIKPRGIHMVIPKVALLIPTDFSSAESTALANSLKKQRFVVLGNNKICVAAKMNDRLFSAIAKSKVVVKDIWVGKLTEKRIKSLPEELRQLSIFWNIYCDQGEKGVEEATVSRSLRQAGFEIKGDRVYDLTERKFVGDKIVKNKGEKSAGNWTLNQSWNWYPVPVFGFLGIPIGHFAVVHLTSSASVVCTSISAKIKGPHHDAYRKVNNAKSASTNSTGFIPFWEVTNNVVLTSKGSYGGNNKTLTTTLTV